jgi:hypothetical protein
VADRRGKGGCDGGHCDKRHIAEAKKPGVSREAVSNLNQGIRVGTDRDHGISAVRMTL